MSTRKPMDPIVEAWLKGTSSTPYGTRTGLGRVMARIRRTHQRGRWWPLPSFPRGPEQHSTDRTAESHLGPATAADGHIPTVTGRTRTMFSPAKAIAAGAVVFALGGVMLINQPFDQRSSAPGASIDAQAEGPVFLTGTLQLAPTCASSPRDDVPIAALAVGAYRCGPQAWRTDDPRLTGEATSLWNADVYRGVDGGPVVTVRAGTYEVRNDAGGWLCHHAGVVRGTGIFAFPDLGETVTCLGDGGHEGLSAVLELDWSVSPVTIQGLIFPGEMPPFPEPSADG
jgi:hypothetical protein